MVGLEEDSVDSDGASVLRGRKRKRVNGGMEVTEEDRDLMRQHLELQAKQIQVKEAELFRDARLNKLDEVQKLINMFGEDDEIVKEAKEELRQLYKVKSSEK